MIYFCTCNLQQFVPKRIKNKYTENLTFINEVQICDERWSVFYNFTGGYLSNIKKMVERFDLRKKETVVFTINDSNVLFARIYQMDGKEINYENRSIDILNYGQINWFWNVLWKSESG